MYVGMGYAFGGMFKFNINSKSNSFVYIVDSINLWHAILGYVNFKSIENMIKVNLLLKCHTEKLEKCDIYIKSKITRKSFHKLERNMKL